MNYFQNGKVLWSRQWTYSLLSKPDYMLKLWHVIIENTTFQTNHSNNRGELIIEESMAKFFSKHIQKSGGKVQKKITSRQIYLAMNHFEDMGWIKKGKVTGKVNAPIVIKVLMYNESQRFENELKRKVKSQIKKIASWGNEYQGAN